MADPLTPLIQLHSQTCLIIADLRQMLRNSDVQLDTELRHELNQFLDEMIESESELSGLMAQLQPSKMLH